MSETPTRLELTVILMQWLEELYPKREFSFHTYRSMGHFDQIMVQGISSNPYYSSLHVMWVLEDKVQVGDRHHQIHSGDPEFFEKLKRYIADRMGRMGYGPT